MTMSVTSKKYCSENQLEFKPFKTPEKLDLSPLHKWKYAYLDPNKRLKNNAVGEPQTMEEAETGALLAKNCITKVFEDAVKNEERFFAFDDYSPFIARIRDGKYQWMTVDVVNGSAIKTLAFHMAEKARDQSIYINTGGHGGVTGNCVSNCPSLGDGKAFLSVLTAFMEYSNISFYTVPPGGLPRIPEQANHIVEGWCYSYCTAKKVDELVNGSKTFGSIPSFFVCDMTNKVMKEPSRFTTCNHIFERTAITDYIAKETIGKNEKKVPCPVVKESFFSFPCRKVLDFSDMKIDLGLGDKIALYLREKEENEKNKQDNILKDKEIKGLKGEVSQLNNVNGDLKGENDDLKEIKKIGGVRFARWEKLQKTQINNYQKMSIPTVQCRSKSHSVIDFAKSMTGSTRNFEATIDFENNKYGILDVYLSFIRLKDKEKIDISIDEKQTAEITQNLSEFKSPKTPFLKSTPINSLDKDEAMKIYEHYQNEIISNFNNLKGTFQNVPVDKNTYGEIANKASKLKEKANPKKLGQLSTFVYKTPKSRKSQSVTPVKQEPKNSGMFSNAYNYFFGGK